MKTVLVTGASGNVGRAVVDALASQPVRIRAMVSSVRSPDSGDTIERVRGDFRDPSTYAEVVAGCDAIFLLRPPPIADVEHTLCPFIDQAIAAGVGHIVFLSVMGADHNRIVPHHKVEVHLARCGVSHTILRPGFFAQNFGDAYRLDLKKDNRIYVPAGRGRVAFVDVRDVGELAADALCHPERHAGRGYPLTGPEAVTFDDGAALLTDLLQRPIRYVPASSNCARWTSR